MTLRSGALLLVALLGIPAGAVRAEEEPKTGSLDKSFALPTEGEDVIRVKTKVGPLMIEQIVLNNLPRKDEVKIAVANSSDDNCRPKIAVVFSNPTALKAKVKVVASFEGATGTSYMSCDRKDNVKPLADENRTDACFGFGALTAMKLRDWPKVKNVHIVVNVSAEH
jgi:hypothetical protein